MPARRPKGNKSRAVAVGGLPRVRSFFPVVPAGAPVVVVTYFSG